jgi:hypothetical protein
VVDCCGACSVAVIAGRWKLVNVEVRSVVMVEKDMGITVLEIYVFCLVTLVA